MAGKKRSRWGQRFFGGEEEEEEEEEGRGDGGAAASASGAAGPTASIATAAAAEDEEGGGALASGRPSLPSSHEASSHEDVSNERCKARKVDIKEAGPTSGDDGATDQAALVEGKCSGATRVFVPSREIRQGTLGEEASGPRRGRAPHKLVDPMTLAAAEEEERVDEETLKLVHLMCRRSRKKGGAYPCPTCDRLLREHQLGEHARSCPRRKGEATRCRVCGGVVRSGGKGGRFRRNLMEHARVCRKFPPGGITSDEFDLMRVHGAGGGTEKWLLAARLVSLPRLVRGARTRSRAPRLSRCGAEAVVKEFEPIGRGGRRDPPSHGGPCSLAVDPGAPFRLRCAECGSTADMTLAKAEYLWCRRRAKATLGLLSVAVPVEGDSSRRIDAVAKSCGIIASNSNALLLALVDGLRVRRSDDPLFGPVEPRWLLDTAAAVERLRRALLFSPSMTLTKIHSIPRHRLGGAIVAAEVTLAASATVAIQGMLSKKDGLALPQLPFHVALGVVGQSNDVDSAIATASILIGLEVELDASKLAVLAPFGCSGGGDAGAGHGPAIVTARETANQLNEKMGAGPVPSWALPNSLEGGRSLIEFYAEDEPIPDTAKKEREAQGDNSESAQHGVATETKDHDRESEGFEAKDIDEETVKLADVICKQSNMGKSDYSYSCPSCKELFTNIKTCWKHISKKGCCQGPAFQCLICNGTDELVNWTQHMTFCRKYNAGDITSDEAALVRSHAAPGQESTKWHLAAKLALLRRQSNRSSVKLSEDRNDAIVKEVKLSRSCPHSGACALAMDPGVLFRLRCAKVGCNLTADLTHAKAEYMWCRQQTEKMIGLLSVSVPLDVDSLDLTKSCGIVSSTDKVCLTLVDGLRVRRSGLPLFGPVDPRWVDGMTTALKKLRMALIENPDLGIERLRTIPMLSNQEAVQVVVDVSLAVSANDEIQTMLSSMGQLSLPQFPFHVVIGTCPSNEAAGVIASLHQKLDHCALKVDAGKLYVLLPYKMSKDDCRKGNRWQWWKDTLGFTIYSAMRTADQLNVQLDGKKSSSLCSGEDANQQVEGNEPASKSRSKCNAREQTTQGSPLGKKRSWCEQRLQEAPLSEEHSSSPLASCGACREDNYASAAPQDILSEPNREEVIHVDRPIRKRARHCCLIEKYDEETMRLAGIISRQSIKKGYTYACPQCRELFGKKQKQCAKHVEKCVPGEQFQCLICKGACDKKEWTSHINICRKFRPGEITSDESALWRSSCMAGKMLKIALATQLATQLVNVQKRSKRSAVQLSDDNTEAIVKTMKMAEKSNRHNGMCFLAVDPNTLFQLRCTKNGCDLKAGMSHAKSEYLWCRRRTKKNLGLLSVLVPLDVQSFQSIDTVARSCGAESNTNTMHLTLIDGLKVWRTGLSMFGPVDPQWLDDMSCALKRLFMALLGDPSLKITHVHAIPRLSDEETVLVVADVSLNSSAATDAIQTILSVQSRIALPQFPLHVAVGACPLSDVDATIAQASAELIGLEVRADAAYFSVLAPSNNWLKEGVKTAKERESNENAFGSAIRAAAETANQLNDVLQRSAGSMFSWSRCNSSAGTKSLPGPNAVEGATSKAHDGLAGDAARNTNIMECPSEGGFTPKMKDEAMTIHHESGSGQVSNSKVKDNEPGYQPGLEKESLLPKCNPRKRTAPERNENCAGLQTLVGDTAPAFCVQIGELGPTAESSSDAQEGRSSGGSLMPNTASQSASNEKSEWSCDLCDVVGENETRYKIHMESKKHRKEAAAQQGLCPPRRKKVEKRIVQALAGYSTRSTDPLERGKDVVVKNILLPGSSHKKKCAMKVDPDKLFWVYCTKEGCNQRVDMTPIESEYHWCRLHTKKNLGLMCFSVYLDFHSSQLVRDIASSCGIASNTPAIPLTLVDGLRALRDEARPSVANQQWFRGVSASLKKLLTALLDDSVLTVSRVNAAPRLRDENTVLITADVTLATSVNEELYRILSDRDLIALPQYPLHFVLGACPSSDADGIITSVSRQLNDAPLKVNARQLCVLPPSAKSKDDTSAYSLTVEVAAETANRLNESLAECDDSCSGANRRQEARATHSLLIGKSNDCTADCRDMPMSMTFDRDDGKDDVGIAALEMEVQRYQVKIQSMCSKIDCMDRELIVRGFI